MNEGLLKGLSEEQIAKIKACKNAEEMLAVAKEEGIELNDDQLAAVSGGSCSGTSTKLREGKVVCPYCHAAASSCNFSGPRLVNYRCGKCGEYFDKPYGR